MKRFYIKWREKEFGTLKISEVWAPDAKEARRIWGLTLTFSVIVISVGETL